jgi:hypothetical protein
MTLLTVWAVSQHTRRISIQISIFSIFHDMQELSKILLQMTFNGYFYAEKLKKHPSVILELSLHQMMNDNLKISDFHDGVASEIGYRCPKLGTYTLVI